MPPEVGGGRASGMPEPPGRALGFTSGVVVREERPKLPKRPGVGAAVVRPRRVRAMRVGVTFIVRFRVSFGCRFE